MLADRLRTSFWLISGALTFLYIDARFHSEGAGGLYLIPLLLFFVLGTAADLCRLVSRAGFPVQKVVIILGSAVVAMSPTVVVIWNSIAGAMPSLGQPYPVDCPIGQMGWIAISLVIAIAMLFLAEMKDYSADSDSDLVLRRLSAGVLVVAYVGVSLAFLVMIRSLGSGNWGLAALLTMIATTKSTDAGAYFAGKAFGRHKLIPRLSPGKTWEGAIGGVIVATIVATLCLLFLFPAILASDHLSGGMQSGAEPVAHPAVLNATDLMDSNLRKEPASELPLGLAFILGPSLAISGMVGDLAESLVKRACDTKDSGNWLPGMGGVWDVTDSLIFAALPAFLCFVAVA